MDALTYVVVSVFRAIAIFAAPSSHSGWVVLSPKILSQERYLLWSAALTSPQLALGAERKRKANIFLQYCPGFYISETASPWLWPGHQVSHPPPRLSYQVFHMEVEVGINFQSKNQGARGFCFMSCSLETWNTCRGQEKLSRIFLWCVPRAYNLE